MASDGAREDRLLPFIAAERSVRALLLIAVGVILLSHLHTDWGQAVSGTAKDFGLDPHRTGIVRLTEHASALTSKKVEEFGVIAIAYGLLEAAEGYGLWRRKRWGEYLTIIATSLLLIPEVWELTKKPTVLKIGGLLLNLAIVIYLIYRLRRRGG